MRFCLSKISRKRVPVLEQSPGLHNLPEINATTLPTSNYIRFNDHKGAQYRLLFLRILANTADIVHTTARCLQSLHNRQTWRRKFIPFTAHQLVRLRLYEKQCDIADYESSYSFGSAFRSFWHTMTSYDRRMLTSTFEERSPP